jgi:CoA:oxalate CoA-transferase
MLGKPLDGIRVVDLTQIYQGPYAAFLMATAGAEVIKVEPLSGERTRGHGGSKTPMSFAMLNSNKKSVTLDLKKEDGKALLRDLVRKADVLLENFAVGTMDRLGLGWESLHEINPSLVYVTGTGYGLTGPDRDLLAMDHTIQAASGIMSVTGDADRPPTRAGGAPCDLMGGVHMYAGTLAALVGRGRTGKGTRVEISMLETMYFTLCSELTAYHATGEIPVRNSARSPAGACPYSRYECKDGWLALICVSENHWRNILAVVGREDLVDDPDFGTAMLRKKREEEVNTMISDWTRARTLDDAFATMREARVAVAPIRNIEQSRTNPHLHERGMLNWMDHPDMGEIVLPNSPMRFSEYDYGEVEFYPEPGADNDAVYGAWLGLDDADLQDLRTTQVI